MPMPWSVVSIFTWTVLCASHAASPPVALTVSARISSAFLGFGAGVAAAGFAGFAGLGADVLGAGAAAGGGAGAAEADAQPRAPNRIQDVAGGRRMSRMLAGRQKIFGEPCCLFKNSRHSSRRSRSQWTAIPSCRESLPSPNGAANADFGSSSLNWFSRFNAAAGRRTAMVVVPG